MAVKKYKKATPTKRKRQSLTRAQKGYVRTEGDYGRFSGPGGELKYHDHAWFGGFSSAMIIQNLLTIVQGNGPQQRIGRKLTVKKVSFYGVINHLATNDFSNVADTGRMYLVQDTQTNGEQFDPIHFLETDNWKAFRNLTGTSRFRVLWQKTWSSQVQTATVTNATPFTTLWTGGTQSFKFTVNCSIPIEYDATETDGSIGTIRSNNLYFVYHAQSGVCSIDANIRIRYDDK